MLSEFTTFQDVAALRSQDIRNVVFRGSEGGIGVIEGACG